MNSWLVGVWRAWRAVLVPVGYSTIARVQGPRSQYPSIPAEGKARAYDDGEEAVNVVNSAGLES